MNPATNVGKKELPPGIRNRFTEFFVDELTDKQDLLLLCSKYLNPLALPASLLDSVVRFYVNIRKEASKSLMDGIGDRPHYSLRTFCRALQVAAGNPCQAARRSLYEGLLLSFLTQLDGNSRPLVEKLLSRLVAVLQKIQKEFHIYPIFLKLSGLLGSGMERYVSAKIAAEINF